MLVRPNDGDVYALLPSWRRRFGEPCSKSMASALVGALAAESVRLLRRGLYFLFSSSFIVFQLCASLMSRLVFKNYVVAEAGCNWYHFDINKFPFLKKIKKNMNVGLPVPEDLEDDWIEDSDHVSTTNYWPLHGLLVHFSSCFHLIRSNNIVQLAET
jgi:hypothetical protein